MSTNYRQYLEDLNEVSCRVLSFYLHEWLLKYNGWKKYPRKVKKYMKKHHIWNTRNQKIQPKDFSIFITKDFSIDSDIIGMPLWMYKDFERSYRNEIQKETSRNRSCSVDRR